MFIGLLSLCTTNTLHWIFLYYEGCTMHYIIFSSVSCSFYLLGDSSIPPFQLLQTKMSSDTTKCPLGQGTEIALVSIHHSIQIF